MKGIKVSVDIKDDSLKVAPVFGKLEPKTTNLIVTENGEYTPPEDIDGFDHVSVNVSTGGCTLEELTITENGEYTPQEGVDGFSKVVANVPGQTNYTGHIDEQGLRAIGWIDRDIEWLRNLVDWNEEEDDVYKVPQELIDAYVEAGNTWSEKLSQDNAQKWWFKYRPRGGEQGLFAYNANCHFMFAFANYEKFPWLENRGMGIAARWTIVNNISTLQAISFWKYSSPIVHINTDEPLEEYGYLFRYNSVIEEIRGELDFSKITTWITYESLASATKLRVIWVKHLKVNFKFVSPRIAKVCVKYMIENEAATSAITIILPAEIYSAYSSDVDILAALANHPNVTLSQG